MRTKFIIVTLMACLAFSRAGAQAGPPSHNVLSDPNLFADAHINGLDSKLHLSEQQKAKLRPMFVVEGKALISILNDSSLREDQRQLKIQQLHEQTRDQVLPILTPSQRKQFDNGPGVTPRRQPKGPQQV